MAIDIAQLVNDQLAPYLELDPTISEIVQRQVDAQIALQGWALVDVTDQRAVYLSVLTLKALIPRLILQFAQELKKAKGGPAEAEFQNAIDALKQLRADVADQLTHAAHEADPEDIIENPIRWPGIGPVSF